MQPDVNCVELRRSHHANGLVLGGFGLLFLGVILLATSWLRLQHNQDICVCLASDSLATIWSLCVG